MLCVGYRDVSCWFAAKMGTTTNFLTTTEEFTMQNRDGGTSLGSDSTPLHGTMTKAQTCIENDVKVIYRRFQLVSDLNLLILGKNKTKSR